MFPVQQPHSLVPRPRRLVAGRRRVSRMARISRQPRLVVVSIRIFLGLVDAARIAVVHRDLKLPRPLYATVREGRLGFVAPIGK